MKNLVRIVPAPSELGRPALTQGTKVLLPDGTEIQGITRIVLTAEVNSIWRADITLHCHAPDFGPVMADLHHCHPLPWWRRLLNMLSPLDGRPVV